MTTNLEFQSVSEMRMLRGFKNLLRKENQSWWQTRRWWVNALLWPGLIGGLVGMMLFILPPLAETTGDPNVAAAGGPLEFGRQMGSTAFFELGMVMMALGVIVLSQDMVIGEKQSGLTEWLLSNPIERRAYLLAKLASNTIVLLIVMIGLPAAVVYGLFFIRLGHPLELLPFLSGIGIMVVHSMFYLTLTIMLGTCFNSRSPLLGITLGSLLGGNLLISLLKPLLYVTPWALPKAAGLLAGSQPVPAGLLWGPIISSVVWSVVFIVLALARFEKEEF